MEREQPAGVGEGEGEQLGAGPDGGPAGMTFLVAAIPIKRAVPPETRFLEWTRSEDCCIAERDGSELVVNLATRATEWQG